MNVQDVFSPRRRRAVIYVRHSDDRQQNSAEIQLEAIREFARKHDIEVIREFVDHGITGLTERRPAFQELMSEWIENPSAPDFEYVLVYDISRFGRFVDLDKSAALEHACKKRGKDLIAIIRGLPEAGHELVDHLTRSIDRYMAAEYSQLLSKKVKSGCVKVVQQGFSAGGSPSYGLVRLLLDEAGHPLQHLKPGDKKIVANQRVTFVPASDGTADVVRRIFDVFVGHGQTTDSIADVLCREKIPSAAGGAWTPPMVRRILQNPAYIGTLTYNKTSGLLRTPRRKMSKAEWIVREHAFPAIVDEGLFCQAQELLDSDRMARAFEHRRYIASFFEMLRSRFSSPRIPLLASVPFRNGGSTEAWCFRVPFDFACESRLLCVGLPALRYHANTYLSGEEKFFIVPQAAFGICRYVVGTERNEWSVDRKTASLFLTNAGIVT